MSSRTCPTRLELHRLRYHQAGGKMSLLSYDDLGPDDFQMISEIVFSTAAQAQGKRNPWDVMAEVLADWGVMCPHPAEKRKSIRPSSFVCGACDVPVMVTERAPAKQSSRAKEAP